MIQVQKLVVYHLIVHQGIVYLLNYLYNNQFFIIHIVLLFIALELVVEVLVNNNVKCGI
jgi:hypothetical protein